MGGDGVRGPAHGVVAIDEQRLEALADALARVADELLRLRLVAYRWLDVANAAAPAEVHDLQRVAGRLRDLAHDCRRRLSIIRNLPWYERPYSTSRLLGRQVSLAYDAATVAAALPGPHSGLSWITAGEYVDRLVDAVGDDPYAAAAALEEIGIDGFRRLYDLARWSSEGVQRDERDRVLEARVTAITGILLAASRTVDHPGGLSRRFVDQLFPERVPVPEDAGGDRAGEAADAFSDVLAHAGAGTYLAEATERAVRGGTGTVITRAGRIVGIFGIGAGIVSGVLNGGDGLPEAVASGVFTIIGMSVSGPVGWAAAGIAVLISIIAAAPGSGRPPARTYPAGQRSPGGSHYERYADGSGKAVAPNGV